MEGCSGRNPSSIFPLVAFLTVLALATKVQTHPNGGRSSSSTEFIRTSCGVTPYPRLCFASLSSHSRAIERSPNQLAYTALSLSFDSARWVRALISNLSLEMEHGVKGRQVGAVKDCVKTVSDSVDQLRKSMGEMGHLGGPDFDFHMSNIRTWVSAALTDDETCMDGFAGNATKGEYKNIVRRQVLKVARLTSNSLALVTNLSVHPRQAAPLLGLRA